MSRYLFILTISCYNILTTNKRIKRSEYVFESYFLRITVRFIEKRKRNPYEFLQIAILLIQNCLKGMKPYFQNSDVKWKRMFLKSC